MDDHSPPNRPDEELPGTDRPPPSRSRRILIAALAAIVLGGGVLAAVVTGTGNDRAAVPRRSAAAPTPSDSDSERAFAIELPQRPPRGGVTAIRHAFPGADLTAFVAAHSDDPGFPLRLTYNLTAGRRLLTVSVEPARPEQDDHTLRTTSSLRLGVHRGPAYVDAVLRLERGTPTGRDYARLHHLVLDPRLLATR